MLPNDPNAAGGWFDLTWVKVVSYVSLATVGGVMGYIMRTLDARAKIDWKRAFIEGASAGFVGLLVYLLCLAGALSGPWTGAIVGLAGWLGANASIRIIEKFVFKKMGIEESKPEESDVDNNPQ